MIQSLYHDFYRVNAAFEVGLFSDKLWSIPVYLNSDTTKLFKHGCLESSLPSVKDLHQVSMENIQFLFKVVGCLTLIAFCVHMSTFKCVKVYVLQTIVQILAWIAICFLTAAELLIALSKVIYDFILD